MLISNDRCWDACCDLFCAFGNIYVSKTQDAEVTKSLGQSSLILLYELFFCFHVKKGKSVALWRSLAIRHIITRKELEPNWVPQLFLGSFLGRSQSAIGQFFPLSLVTVPEVFAKVNSVQFLLASWVANLQSFFVRKQVREQSIQEQH